MSIEFGGQAVAWWIPAEGPPVQLSGQVSAIELEPDEVDEVSSRYEWATPITLRFTLRFRGRDTLTPTRYWLLLGRTHPRIRRMHSAYGRRRGRGRW